MQDNALSATLNNDLNKIKEWAYNWKMSFNLEINHKIRKSYFQGSFEKISGL